MSQLPQRTSSNIANEHIADHNQLHLQHNVWDGRAPNDFAPAAHFHAASAINAGILDPSRLGAGTPGPTTVLYGNSQWGTLPALPQIVLPVKFYIDGDATVQLLEPVDAVFGTWTIARATLDCKTGNGPSGAALVVDILMNGTSIWTGQPANRVTLAAGGIHGQATVFATTAVPDGAIFAAQIISVGTTPGKNITINVFLTR